MPYKRVRIVVHIWLGFPGPFGQLLIGHSYEFGSAKRTSRPKVAGGHRAERGNADDVAGFRCLNDVAGAYINCDMVDSGRCAVVAPEDEIAGKQLGRGRV